MSVTFELVPPDGAVQENCIQQIEELIATRLPEDFREFLEQYDGGVPLLEDVTNVLVLPDPEADADVLRFVSSREILNFLRGQSAHAYWQYFTEGVVPFAIGSCVEWGLGVTGPHSGSIVILYHELVPVAGVAAKEDSYSWEATATMSFSQLLEVLVPQSSLE